LTVVAVTASAVACGGHESGHGNMTRGLLPRRTVVWLPPSGLDGDWADRLQRAGVDELVVRRGKVVISGSAPVLRLVPAPVVEGSIPVAVALTLELTGDDVDPVVAAAVWDALTDDPDWVSPSELILDLPMTPSGTADFVRTLSMESSVRVLPLLTRLQLADDEAVAVAIAARECVVPLFGTDAGGLRGLSDGTTSPLADQLGPLAATGVRVRAGISLVPTTQPEIDGWGDDLGGLAERQVAEVSTTSALDRTFILREPVEWSGRQWSAGDELAIRWFDVSRLDRALAESSRLILPELGGWDLVWLPPRADGLGMGRAALVSYLEGHGPGPSPEVEIESAGSGYRLRFSNPTSFASAVTTVGNWVEIGAATGPLVAENRGDFDRVELGTGRGRGFRSTGGDRLDTLRLYETYLGPGEVLTSGPIRVPSNRSPLTIRWQITLSSGAIVTGDARSGD
jgi:hypothetical protein